jgi:hypothetical protein
MYWGLMIKSTVWPHTFAQQISTALVASIATARYST